MLEAKGVGQAVDFSLDITINLRLKQSLEDRLPVLDHSQTIKHPNLRMILDQEFDRGCKLGIFTHLGYETVRPIIILLVVKGAGFPPHAGQPVLDLIRRVWIGRLDRLNYRQITLVEQG